MEIKKSLENRLNIKTLNSEDLTEKVKIPNKKENEDDYLIDNQIYLEYKDNKKSYNFTAMEWIKTWRVIE